MITPAKCRAVFCVVGVILSSAGSWSSVYADSWGPPQKEHWSANKRFVLQVKDSEPNSLSLCEKSDDGLKKHWTRGYVDSVWPPRIAYVTNDGKYVVLRDVHHSVGYGKVIVILGAGGKILGSYELADFLSQDEIRSAKLTVSSLWWSDNAWFSFLNDEQEFALATQEGTVRCFDLASGKLLDLTDDKRAKVVGLVRKDAESWLTSGNVSERIQGITLLGALQFKDAIPEAKRLFQDKTPTGSISGSGNPNVEVYNVQKAAALTLVRLIGLEAIPIIEAELPQANWYMKRELTSVLDRLEANPGKVGDTSASTALKEMWLRLAGNPDAEIRYHALCQVLRRDDGTFLRQHPELIESDGDFLRRVAVSCLSKLSSPEALPLLRKAIVDKHSLVRRSAIQQFIDRQPPDLVEVLLPYLDDDYALIRQDVICELACWRHPSAIAKLRETVAVWPNADLKGDGKFDQRCEIEIFCKLIADLRLHEMRDGLVASRSAGVASPRTAIIGALAALGDSQAISALHRIASGIENGDRSLAIQMCRYLSDPESVALVKKAAEEGSAFDKSAATDKLRRFQDRRKPPPVP
jgi:HEAT repeat protein